MQEILPLNKLDSIKEDCIIGSEFLDRARLVTFDKHKMLFKCTINCRIVYGQMSFEAILNVEII